MKGKRGARGICIGGPDQNSMSGFVICSNLDDLGFCPNTPAAARAAKKSLTGLARGFSPADLRAHSKNRLDSRHDLRNYKRACAEDRAIRGRNPSAARWHIRMRGKQLEGLAPFLFLIRYAPKVINPGVRGRAPDMESDFYPHLTPPPPPPQRRWKK